MYNWIYGLLDNSVGTGYGFLISINLMSSLFFFQLRGKKLSPNLEIDITTFVPNLSPTPTLLNPH